MMLVVVLLLLPVFLTGASLEVPGVGCDAQNCCLMSNCHGHAECAPVEGPQVHGHRHHHHSHDRIYLLCDAGLRTGQMPLAAPLVAVPEWFVRVLPLVHVQPLQPCGNAPPLYPGHVVPLRC